MDRNTVFTKTAKGITQVNQKSASLSKDLMKVLKLIDGKSNFGQLLEKAEIDKGVLEKALNTLAKDGFARIFETRKEEIDPFASGNEDDFDFTAPHKLPASTQRVVAGAANDISELVRQQEAAGADKKAREAAHEAARMKAKVEAEARVRADAEAKARQQAEQQAMEQARKAKEASERARLELESKMREEETRKQAIAQQQAKLTSEQKAKEEEEGRKLAELRVRAEREAKALAEARARAEAEAAAMAKARAEAEAAAKKQAAEASNAEAAMKARLKEEIEARIRAEMTELLKNEVDEKTQTRAEMQAEIMAEARLAAKAELEERLREERKTIAMAEADARVGAERDAMARAEEESKKRAAAEARAAAETEARMKAEEETRQLRAQAEVQSKRAEEESRKLRAQAEEQNRKAEEEARRLKAEGEERARKLKAEGEEQARVLKAQAEQEQSRLRAAAEAEARRAKETEARARDAEARAKAESDAAARDRATVEERVNAERQAKYEAEARAKIEAEEADRRQRELSATIEAERKAKEEAEMRARIESRARETIAEDTRAKVQAEIEGDMVKRAEIEGKAQAKAYMQAKDKAERDEDDRIRSEQARKARDIADILRTKVTPDNEAPEFTPSQRRARRKDNHLVRNIMFALLGGVIVAIIAVHVIPMRNLAVKVEKAMSAWLHDDVSIASTTFRLLPAPHLRVENLAVGKLLDAKAQTGKIFLDVASIFSDKLSISAIELDDVTVSNDAVRRIPVWGRTEGKAETGAISSILLKNVKIDVKPTLENFDAALSFARDGKLTDANITAKSGWTLAMKPGEKGVDLDFYARNWALPYGANFPISLIQLKGVWSGTEVVIPEFEASTMEGKVQGTLRISWAQGVKLESDLSLSRVNAKELVRAFTKDVSVTGKLDGNFAFVASGPTVDQIFAETKTNGKFKLAEGSVSNVDLVAVMQSDAAGQRAGVTKFAELTGEVTISNRNLSYRNINLQGGVLRGTGGLDIGANSNLTGRLNLEIRSQVAQDRGGFPVSGTVARPIIRRGS
ncbi:MAG: AsmA-like C-terminal region-containing protein [Usitatibacter sp.]